MSLLAARIIETEKPAWMTGFKDCDDYIGAVEVEGSGIWHFVETDYEKDRIVTPFREAVNDDQVRTEILPFWSRDQVTLEHFRMFCALGFPSPGIGHPHYGKLSTERLEQLYQEIATFPPLPRS